MLEAPIGSARFNNEFGRPSLTGTFRTLLTKSAETEAPDYRGYHKPIMVSSFSERDDIPVSQLLKYISTDY